MSKLRPVLLLEVNEVHWRILDRALERTSPPQLRRFVDRAMTRTTHADDAGVLSPWITWPSLHRGTTEHGIRALGQDVTTFRGTPIWEEYRQRGLSIGVCGSLQSWPPIDPGPGGFYVPDTFARDARCVPSWVDPLQQLNLRLVRENGRVRTRRMPYVDALRAVPAAVRAHVSPRLAARAAGQLLTERWDPSRVARRPTFQTLLFWDVFKGLFDARRPPAFSTFFTNHVAGVMHRHWDEVFPEDFPERPVRTAHARVVTFAFEVLDELLGDALALQQACPDLILVVASSMGQAAVHRHWHHGRELKVRDLGRLLASIGVPPSAYSELLAMVPQVAAQVSDETWQRAIERDLRACRSASGLRIFRVDARGATLSITVGTPPSADVDAGAFTLGDGTRVTWAEAGLEVCAVAAGTGNHVPEGSLAIVGRDIAPDASRRSMRATEVRSLLLELAGVRGKTS